jgi:hypothetical protein
MTGYVAPAHKILTCLHRPDPSIPPVTAGPDPSDGATVCGLQMLTEEGWMDVEARDGDQVCTRCSEPSSLPQETGEALF